jgi:6-phosphofructokinase 1
MLQSLGSVSDVHSVHAIKTIDNDLPGTHHCPGFGSAALFNATAVKNVFNDVCGYRGRAMFDIRGKAVPGWKTVPVMVYQAMGRNTGWLTQAAAFAKVDPKGELDPARPPHVFLSWETPFEEQEFLDTVQQAIDRHGTAVVVVGEGIRLPGPERQSLAEREKSRSQAEVRYDESGNEIYGGASSFSSAIYLARFVAGRLKTQTATGEIKERAFVPQHIQRSAMMSPVDASDAYRVGWAAAEAVDRGETRRSVVLVRDRGTTTTSLVDVSAIAAETREVDPHYLQGLDGPTQAFIDEFIYLIGGPVAIPHYSAMRLPAVELPA